MRSLVVITVPHAICPTLFPKDHFCDYFAPTAAEAIRSRLEALGVDSIVFTPKPGEDRTVCDLNRPWCRTTRYRQELFKFVNQNRDKILFVLDVHSFPPGSRDYGATSITILDDDHSYDMRFQWYTMNLGTCIERAGIQVGVAPGELNDIQDEMRELGFESLLVEFNENLAQGQNRPKFETLVRVISRWFKDWVGKSNLTVSHRINRID